MHPRCIEYHDVSDQAGSLLGSFLPIRFLILMGADGVVALLFETTASSAIAAVLLVFDELLAA